MNKLLSGLLIILISTSTLLAQESETNWLTNLETAQETALKENKFILLNFSGSDWCTNCKRLHKSLFETEEFAAFAQQELVLLNLDFPAKKKNRLPKEQQAYNDKLAEKYNKKGSFPTVLILDTEGNIKGKISFPMENVSSYLKKIKSITAN